MSPIITIVAVMSLVGCLDSPKPREDDTLAETEITPDSAAPGADVAPDGDSAPDADAEVETLPEAETDAEVETLPDADAEVDTVPDADTEVDTVPNPDTAPDLNTTPDADTDTGVEPDIDVAPDPDVVDAGPLALILTQDAERWTIDNDQLHLAVTAASGWTPSELSTSASSANVIHGIRDGPLGETNEEWVGLSLFDMAHLWRDDVSPGVIERGPAVIRMSKTWQFVSSEGAGTLMTGRSDIAIHADGRVFLSYDVALPTQRVATLVSYVVLDITRFTKVAFGTEPPFSLPSGLTSPGQYVFLGETARTDTPYLCAWATDNASDQHAVGLVSRVLAANPMLPRITENAFTRSPPFGPAHSIRLQYDLARSPVVAGSYAARLLMTIDGGRDCTRVAALASAFRAPPQLLMETGLLERDETGDSDGDGYNEVTGAYTLSAAGRRVTWRPQSDLPSVTLRVVAPTWGTVAVSVGDSPLIEGTDFIAQRSSESFGGWVVIAREIARDAPVDVSW